MNEAVSTYQLVTIVFTILSNRCIIKKNVEFWEEIDRGSLGNTPIEMIKS